MASEKYAYGKADATDRMVMHWEVQEALRRSMRENGDHLTFRGAISSYLSGRVYGEPTLGFVWISGEEDVCWLIDAEHYLSSGLMRLAIGRAFSGPEMAILAWREGDR